MNKTEEEIPDDLRLTEDQIDDFVSFSLGRFSRYRFPPTLEDPPDDYVPPCDRPEEEQDWVWSL